MRKEQINPFGPGGHGGQGPQASGRRRPASAATFWLWVGVAVLVFALVFTGYVLLRSWRGRIEIAAVEKGYHHYDIVTIRLHANDRALRREWAERPPMALVTRGGELVTTIGNLRGVPLVYDRSSDSWLGRWPVPWNAPDGEYLPALAGPPELQPRVRARPFRLERRSPRQIPPGFVAVNLETDKPLRFLKVRAPDGTVKGWEGLLDWVQTLKGDAFWVLAGVTPGAKPDEVWLKYNLPVLQDIGRECHRRGIKFGVWTMCYLTSKRPPLGRYEYAQEHQDGRMRPTRAISIRDPKRPDDLIEFLKPFAAMPEVDFIGLDYIRNAMGGYELADDFFREMPGAVAPAGWDRLDPEERMVQFERVKVMRKDKDFIDRWQWWRAHRIAGVVAKVKAALGPEKTLWAFTLGWQRGWQHGQDPVMMNDAGVDVDAVMLYESDRPQFDWMVKDWNRYLSASDAQLMVADVIDWPLHQYTVDPSGPEEYARRMREAIDGMYRDGRVKGIFIHDLNRLLFGRKGPYSTADWAKGVKEAIEYLRSASTVASPLPNRERARVRIAGPVKSSP